MTLNRWLTFVDGVGRLDLPAKDVQFRLCRRERDTRPEPGEHVEIAMLAPGRIRGGHQRLEKVRAVAQNVGRQHAENREPRAVDADRLPHDTCIRGKAAAPVGIGEDQDVVAPRLKLLREESPPQRGADAERREPLRRDDPAEGVV